MPGKPVILWILMPSLASCEKSHMTALRVGRSLAGQLLPSENFSPDIPQTPEIPIKTPIRRERARGMSVVPSFQRSPPKPLLGWLHQTSKTLRHGARLEMFGLFAGQGLKPRVNAVLLREAKLQCLG